MVIGRISSCIICSCYMLGQLSIDRQRQRDGLRCRLDSYLSTHLQKCFRKQSDANLRLGLFL
jgi:hypothetical protein